MAWVTLMKTFRKCNLNNMQGTGLRILRKISRRSWTSEKAQFQDVAARDTAPSDAPLKGIKVLDLSRILAGPYCTMILGDMGAEIIKVEKPGVGDDTRTWGPPFMGSESCYYLCVNRNKKSVTVNMKKPEGVKLIKELAAISDVLVENYIPGTLSRMGLGYPELSAEFPHLIYCSITGYGQTGKYATRAGYDVIVSGIGGLMNITGPAVGCIMKTCTRSVQLDKTPAEKLLEMVKILWPANYIEVASLVNVASNYLNAGQEGNRYGTAHASIVPYQAFRTSDGYIIVGAGNDSQFKVLGKLVGHPEIATDELYLTNKARVENRVQLLGLLNNVFEQKSTSEWLDVFEGSGIPYGPINSTGQVFSDPQVHHNCMIQEMTHPTIGPIRVAGPAVRFSETKTVDPTAPPLLGQHTDAVLKGLLGYSDESLSVLRKQKVID